MSTADSSPPPTTPGTAPGVPGGDVQWVFFDAGGTLFETGLWADPILLALGDLRPAQLPDRLDARLQQAYRAAMVADHLGPPPDWPIDAERARRRWDRLLDALIAAVGLQGQAALGARERLWQALATPQLFPLFDDARSTVERLAGLGYRLAVVSNWEPRLEHLCSRHALRAHFQFVLASEAAGFAKPSGRLYRRALALADVQPGQIVLVGDSLELDVQAASAVGLHAILLDRGGYYPPGAWRPTISSLDALPAALTSLGQTIGGRAYSH
jgi:HAD superfamily hydrolase (TIGR01549 family)